MHLRNGLFSDWDIFEIIGSSGQIREERDSGEQSTVFSQGHSTGSKYPLHECTPHLD